MTNQTKAAFRMGLLVLAVILTALSVLFLHSTEGDTAFIGSVEHWEYINWTPTIVEVVVIWAAYAFCHAALLRPSAPPNANQSKPAA